ncbi:MAG: methyltransferase domain-containing protein [Elusimicrobiota bacterium]|nr:methyltransferase domain-containing protein [Elusimicrobiota bacterium]
MMKKYFKLFFISFAALFLEIACIRWFNSNVVMLSYFSNFVLLACFLGLGVGMLLVSKKTDFIVVFPSIFLILCVIFWKVIIRLTVNSDISVYFTASGFAKGVPLYNAGAWWFLPVIFILATVMFISIGQEVGRAFSGIKPLVAYMINIFGSILGVGLFTAISFFNSSPLVWFVIAFLCLLPFLFKKRLFYFNVLAFILSFFFLWMISYGAIFSPYYRIDVINNANAVIVNGIPHQIMLNIDKEFVNNYEFPYKLVKKPKKVLILGAGTGNDAAVALKNGAEKIDAVEIDPVIIEIGNRHPNKPYQDKKVKVFNDDARAFLKKSDEKYDLIIFALIDSLTVFSQFSSVRLENFIFTKDAFEDVKRHLTDDGVVVIYNQFRKIWLVERLSKMLEETFGKKTIVYNEQEKEHFAVLFNGPGIEKINFPQKAELFPKQKVPLFLTSNYQIKSTTDDWPFLYLKNPTIPIHYVVAIFMILFFAGLLVFVSSDISYGINNHFFFLGAGFMILETSAIIRMAMLFGSTWIVNSIVIIAILVMAFFATYITNRFSPDNNKRFYIYLFLIITANILIPLKTFLIFPYYLKIILSSLLLFLPIYFSGVIFATSFSKSENPQSSLGSNLIGSMFGGCLEYIALKYGYGSLMFLLLGVYLVSIKNFRWKFR